MSEPGIRTAVAAALLSALLLWMSAPPIAAGWLAWVALVPAAVVVLRASATNAGRLAVPLAYAIYLELLLVPALPFGLADGQWGDPAIPVLIGGSPVLGVALVAIPLVGVGTVGDPLRRALGRVPVSGPAGRGHRDHRAGARLDGPRLRPFQP